MPLSDASQNCSQHYSFTGIGSYGAVTQRCNKKITQLMLTQPLLFFVLQGKKQILTEDTCWNLEAGSCVLLAANQSIDIVNMSGDSGEYRGYYFTWQPALIEKYQRQAHQYQTEQNQQQINYLLSSKIYLLNPLSAAFEQSLNYMIQSCKQFPTVPLPIIEHRFCELLRWFDLFNISVSPPSFEFIHIKIRHIISQKPDKKWVMADICHLLAMSEATLRRKLRDEQTSLTQLLIDVKMGYGLTLLQTTKWPVSRIALECGYDSASRFAVRFRQRFGFSPKAIRGRASH